MQVWSSEPRGGVCSGGQAGKCCWKELGTSLHRGEAGLPGLLSSWGNPDLLLLSSSWINWRIKLKS